MIKKRQYGNVFLEKNTKSTNLYKFCYDSLDKVKELYNILKKDNKKFFLDYRKADYRYEFGVYDEDDNMILVTKLTDY